MTDNTETTHDPIPHDMPPGIRELYERYGFSVRIGRRVHAPPPCPGDEADARRANKRGAA